MIGLLERLMGRKPRTAAPELRPDFHAVGYPKTGNTWTRIMFGRYVRSVYDLVEMPLFDPVEMAEMRAAGYAGPLGEFTHHPLTWKTQRARDLSAENVVAPFRGRRVVFLTRHPLDTLVSAFMQARFKVAASPYPGDLADFIADPVYGLEKLIRFHEIWAEHHGETADFLLWRYEDVRTDPAGQMRRLLAFLGIPLDETALADAVDFASFDNLKAVETSGTRLVYKSSGFNAFGDGPRDDPNAFLVRKGRIKGYKDELDAACVARLEDTIRSTMPKMFVPE
ncbi:sulfotransferase domain-containing protein [Oleispirillum naphthae]|uniref:sulfotransferase domain-containing protein n=1 Tax=Oleispirillum naphthae TaxID=2838853 RepID=UPI0030822436